MRVALERHFKCWYYKCQSLQRAGSVLGWESTRKLLVRVRIPMLLRGKWTMAMSDCRMYFWKLLSAGVFFRKSVSKQYSQYEWQEVECWMRVLIWRATYAQPQNAILYLIVTLPYMLDRSITMKMFTFSTCLWALLKEVKESEKYFLQ